MEKILEKQMPDKLPIKERRSSQMAILSNRQ